MSRINALIHLGLEGQDFGPCYADEWTHEEFAVAWRGSVPCPSEAAIAAAVPPPPSLADLKAQALAQARLQRQPILSMLDGMQASALVKGETVKATSIESAKQGLKDLTKINLVACLTADDFKVKIMTRYREIAAALPADVRIAFAEALK